MSSWRAISAACWLYELQFFHCVSGCTPYGCLANYTAAKVGDLFKWSAGGTLHCRHEVAVNQLIIKQQQLVQMLYFIFSQQVLTETLQCHCIKYVFISLHCLLYICGSLFTCHAETWIQVSIGGLCLFVTQIEMERNPYPPGWNRHCASQVLEITHCPQNIRG